LLFPLALLAADKNGSRSPNVVFILADDLGYGDLGIHGSKSIPTPHIDALAKGGVRFTDAYVTAASCSPSRAVLMTGRFLQRFGFEFNTSGAAIPHRPYGEFIAGPGTNSAQASEDVLQTLRKHHASESKKPRKKKSPKR
jgi:arylsulfatase A-like enzyme